MFLIRSYSHHSLLSAVPQITDLVKNALEKGYTTIALTDEDTGSGFVEFFSACKKVGIKGVPGATFRVPIVSGSQGQMGSNVRFNKVALIAKSEVGYKALIRLITIARTINEKPKYHLTLNDILTTEGSTDLITVLCGDEHEIGEKIKSGDVKGAETVLEHYTKSCKGYTIIYELLLGKSGEQQQDLKQWNQILAKLCDKFGVQTVVSPAPRYLTVDDNESFRTVLAIRDGKRLNDIQLWRDFSLPAVQELNQKFSEDFNSYLDTSNIEEMCNVTVRTDFDEFASEAYFPRFALPEGQNASDRLIYESYIGLFERFHPSRKSREEFRNDYPYERVEQLKRDAADIKPDVDTLFGYSETFFQNNPISDYIARINFETGIIISKGFADYFLVFGDLMQFCRNNGIVINTRGSAAGSLVGFLNNINILDPMKYKLPFERFLNPFRPTAPDIDGDFADDRRTEVIDYITRKYGKEKVCQIITFGTMLPRAAVRDVGRVLGVSYRKCDRLSKLIPIAPQGKKTTFKWAFEMSEELKQVYEKDEESRRIITIAQKIEGNYRHASVHAAGVIIAPEEVWKYAPLQWDSDHEMIICQYDMRNAEKAGLIKMDILGIRNLAILGNTITIAEERRAKKIDLLNVDIEDEKTYDLLSKGRTMGTFQLSGPAMTKYLVEMGPTKVQDLMAMVALYRPGAMASIPEYLARKKNPKLVKYLVPQMKEWMEESYGIFVYQEDVLFTAIELAGYNWGEADKIRKGLGKKIQAVIEEQHPKFVKGCVEKSGISEEKAEEIWSLIVPFGAYGFNKAHSSSYGMVAYWTAYMKANYPAEFMTALMTAENNNLDKIADAIKECSELGLKVLPPDINKSIDVFSIEDDKTIRYGLSSVKNLGSDVVKFIIKERQTHGLFRDLSDFLARASQFQGFNKKSLEALIWSGSLDSIGEIEKIKNTTIQKNQKMKIS